MIFIKTLHKIFKLGLILQIMKKTASCLKENKINWIKERRIRRQKIWQKFSRLRAKAFSYLLDDRSEDKKVKDKKSVSSK